MPDKDSSKAPSPEPANRPAEAAGRAEDQTGAPAEPQKSVHQSAEAPQQQMQFEAVAAAEE